MNDATMDRIFNVLENDLATHYDVREKYAPDDTYFRTRCDTRHIDYDNAVALTTLLFAAVDAKDDVDEILKNFDMPDTFENRKSKYELQAKYIKTNIENECREVGIDIDNDDTGLWVDACNSLLNDLNKVIRDHRITLSCFMQK